MKKRFIIALGMSFVLLSACQSKNTADASPQSDQPQSAAKAPSSEPPSQPQDTAKTQAETPATPNNATTKDPSQQQPPADSNTALVEGTDYETIDGGVPFSPIAGKIEVVEVFGYVCPACFSFQSLLAPWKAHLPNDVHFVYVPALFGGTWDNYARAYYAAVILGVEDKTHDALFKAIHVDHTLKGEQGMDSLEDIAHFYAKYGVSANQFINTMKSFGVDAKIAQARSFAMRSQIQGTPSLIVDGKYRVKGRSFADMLRITDALIARERASMAHPSTNTNKADH